MTTKVNLNRNQTQNQQSEPQLLKLLNGHVVSLHHSKGFKAVFVENVIYRISCIIIPIIIINDVLIGVGLILSRTFVLLVVKPFKGESVGVTSNDLLRIAKKVVIIIIMSPVFSILMILTPYKAAKLYFKVTNQNPYFIAPKVPARETKIIDVESKLPKTGTKNLKTHESYSSNKTSIPTPPPLPPALHAPKSHLPKKTTTIKKNEGSSLTIKVLSPDSANLHIDKFLSKCNGKIIETISSDNDSEWNEIPDNVSFNDSHSSLSLKQTSLTGYSNSSSSNANEIKQPEFIKKYQTMKEKSLQGKGSLQDKSLPLVDIADPFFAYKKPLPPTPLKVIQAKLSKAKNNQIYHKSSSLTESNFLKILGAANLLKTKLMVPISDFEGILEIDQLKQHVFEKTQNESHVIFTVHLSQKLSVKYNHYIIEEDED